MSLELMPYIHRFVLANLESKVTLGSLPEDARWRFATKDLAILCDAGEPLPLNIYGVVRYASLCGFRMQLPLTLRIRPWSTKDEEQAARIFPTFKRGTNAEHQPQHV